MTHCRIRVPMLLLSGVLAGCGGLRRHDAMVADVVVA